jgi:heme A synthase
MRPSMHEPLQREAGRDISLAPQIVSYPTDHFLPFTRSHMLTGLLHAHSGLRYLVLLAGIIAIAYAAASLVSRRPYDRFMRTTASAFAGLLHLQVLLGFVLIVSGTFYPALIGHIFLMILAAVVAQIPVSVMRRRPPEARSHLPHLVGNVVAFGLIWAGIAAIGRGLFGSGML